MARGLGAEGVLEGSWSGSRDLSVWLSREKEDGELRPGRPCRELSWRRALFVLSGSYEASLLLCTSYRHTRLLGEGQLDRIAASSSASSTKRARLSRSDCSSSATMSFFLPSLLAPPANTAANAPPPLILITDSILQPGLLLLREFISSSLERRAPRLPLPL